MIEFKNVTKSYGKNNVTALKNINLKIENGEFVFLIGNSGAGKSTLLELLLCEQFPDKGDIIYDDVIINNMSKKRIPAYRRDIGVIFQDFKLLDNKTVYENVALAMEIAYKSSYEIKERVPQVLDMVSISNRADFYPAELSGGEQQRVGIARAIVNEPYLIIADEPTGNLDPENAFEIIKILNNINAKGTTVIVATHDYTMVNYMCKRVVQLHVGEILRDELRGRYV